MSRSAVHKKIVALLEEAEELYLEEPKDPGRFFFMRPSGFPYCGLRKLLTAPTYLIEDRLANLASAYFTGVGTAAHFVFQKYLGRLQSIVGNWRCPSCGDIDRFSTFSMCKACKVPRHYDELEVFYRNAVVGHTDALFRVDPDKGKKSKHYVIDYKTSAYYKTKSPTAHKIFPLRSNVAQIKMYIVLLEECFGIKVDGWCLVYLGRDLPLGKSGRHVVTVEVSEEEKRKCKKRLDRWVKVHRKVLKAKSLKDLPVIKKYKLCKSLKDYKDNVKDDYNPCPIEMVCFDEKKLDAFAEKRLGKYKIYPLIEQAPSKIRKILDKGDT
jgi:hypothetical protein